MVMTAQFQVQYHSVTLQSPQVKPQIDGSGGIPTHTIKTVKFNLHHQF